MRGARNLGAVQLAPRLGFTRVSPRISKIIRHGARSLSLRLLHAQNTAKTQGVLRRDKRLQTSARIYARPDRGFTDNFSCFTTDTSLKRGEMFKF